MLPRLRRCASPREPMSDSRVVRASHGLRTVEPDPEMELTLTADLKRLNSPDELLQLAARHAANVPKRVAPARTGSSCGEVSSTRNAIFA